MDDVRSGIRRKDRDHYRKRVVIWARKEVVKVSTIIYAKAYK